MKPSINFETVLYVAGLAAFAAMIAGGLPVFRATGVSAVTVSASIDGIHEAFGQIETKGAERQSVKVVTNHVDDAYFNVRVDSTEALRGS